MLAGQTSKLTITRKGIAAFVLLFFISTPVVISPGIFSVLMLAYLFLWLIATGLKLPRDAVTLSVPLLMLIVVGLLNSFHNEAYNVAKDIWYVGKSLLALLIGYLVMLKIRDLRLALRAILLSASFGSIYHLNLLLTRPGLFQQALYEFRSDVGALFYIVGMGIAVIAASRRYSVELFRKHKWIVYILLPVCAASLILSFSRTMIFTMIIMLLIIYNLLKIKYLNKAMILVLIVAALSSFTLIPMEDEDTSAYRTFMAKIGHTFKEILVREYEDPREMTLNWRGYESYRALQTFRSGGPVEYLVGHGFGSLIDLGAYVQLGDDEYRTIPVLHNGYMYLLVKTGATGLLIYLFFFYRIITYAKQCSSSEEEDVQLAGKLITAVSMVLLVTTIGVAGLFNKNALMPFIFILGALLSFVRMRTGTAVFGKHVRQGIHVHMHQAA